MKFTYNIVEDGVQVKTGMRKMEVMQELNMCGSQVTNYCDKELLYHKHWRITKDEVDTDIRDQKREFPAILLDGWDALVKGIREETARRRQRISDASILKVGRI